MKYCLVSIRENSNPSIFWVEGENDTEVINAMNSEMKCRGGGATAVVQDGIVVSVGNVTLSNYTYYNKLKDLQKDIMDKTRALYV